MVDNLKKGTELSKFIVRIVLSMLQIGLRSYPRIKFTLLQLITFHRPKSAILYTKI